MKSIDTQIIDHLTQGKSYRYIQNELGVSPQRISSVKKQYASLFGKHSSEALFQPSLPSIGSEMATWGSNYQNIFERNPPLSVAKLDEMEAVRDEIALVEADSDENFYSGDDEGQVESFPEGQKEAELSNTAEQVDCKLKTQGVRKTRRQQRGEEKEHEFLNQLKRVARKYNRQKEWTSEELALLYDQVTRLEGKVKWLTQEFEISKGKRYQEYLAILIDDLEESCREEEEENGFIPLKFSMAMKRIFRKIETL